MNADAKTYKYFAFISYSRKDSKVAAWLQKRLEWFRFPVKLVPEDRRPPNPKYVRPVYRDKTNLEVTDEHYWTNIRRALEESRFLIVLCSPNSARSEPVNMEVKHFLEVHAGDTSRVVPVIVGGNVMGKGEDAALCPALRDLRDPDEKPMTDRNLPTMVSDADIAEQDAWESGFVALSSYLLQLERDAIGDHIQRESRKQARTLRLWLGAVIALGLMAVAAGWYAWGQKNRALLSEQKTADALKETQRQLEFSWLEEGRAWLERARTAKGEKDHLKALMLAGRAVGFVGYGRKENDTPEIEKAYPVLLGRGFKDAKAEKQRQAELKAVQEFVDSVSPTCLPIWSDGIKKDHKNSLSSVAFSPDGSRIALGAEDYTVKIWDAALGKEIATLQKHTGEITSVAFSPDGRCIASGSSDGTVKIWDVVTGKEKTTLRGHSSGVNSVAFSPNGSRIVSGYVDDIAKLWEAATGKEMLTLRGHSNQVTSVAFSPDGSRIASGSWDKTVKLWDATTGNQLESLEGDFGEVYSVAFSPDGRHIASGGEYTLKVWNTATGEEMFPLRGHSGRVTSVIFSNDGTCLASGAWDQTVKLWDCSTFVELATIQGHSDRITCVAFSPDGSYLASVAWDSTLRLWDTNTGKDLVSLQGHSEVGISVAFNPDGRCIASGAGDRKVKLWDAATGKELATFHGHSDEVTSVAFNSDGSRVVSGSYDRTVKLWDTFVGKEIATFNGHSYPIYSVAFSPDGSRIASGSDTIKLWDLATGNELTEKPDFEMGTTTASPDESAQAIIDNKIIHLVPTDKTLPLIALERNGYLSLEGRDVAWKASYSPLNKRVLNPVFWRRDLLAQIAEAGTDAEKIILRLQLSGKGGQWRVLPTLWNEALKARLNDNAQVRLEFCIQAAIALRSLALKAKPEAPVELWNNLLTILSPPDWKEPILSLTLAEAVLALLAMEKSDDLIRSIYNQLLPIAPKPWLEFATPGLSAAPKQLPKLK